MNKDLNFECIEDFADYIVEEVELDDGLFVSVVGKFEEIKNIIKEVFCIAEVEFESLNIESDIINGYEDEYVLDCWCNDGVIQIGCEPVIRDGKYLNLCGDETYLLESCSSKIISLCEGSKVYFVNFDEDCDCDEECDGCCCCDYCDDCVEYTKVDNGNIHGFTARKSTGDGYHSYSFYTNDNLSKSYIFELLKNFGF